MKRKRLKSILACMLVLSMAFRVQSAVFAAEADNTLGPKEIMDDTTTLNSGIAPVNVEERDSSFFEVTNLNEMIGAFAQINETQGDYTISLKDNIVLAGGSEKPFKVPAGCTVTLLGNGHTITYNNDGVSAQSNLTLGADGGILNLGNDSRNELIITTNNNQNHADPLLVILSGGTVNMYDGVTLTGNVCTSSNAGGVDIQEGTFNMFGGTISKCETYFGLGGGVRVCADIYTLNTAVAAFNMYGGTISENKATYAYGGYGDGGGVAVMNSNSTFTMTDGLIEKNQADYRGGGICNLFGGNTVINGGVIKENTAIKQYGGGICNYHGTMKIKNVTIENNGARNGGGIGSVYLIEYQDYYLSKMDISNCKIQNNSATYGGGMYSTSSPDVSLSDCTITANEASYGGGAYVYKSDDTTFVNSKISGNLADYGGGVYVNAADVTFVKSEISGNTAGIGGGLYGYAASTATAFISAGEAGNIICNNALLNTEGVFATDVYLNGASAKATLPAAKEMNRTFLADGQNQIIDGWYQDSADSRYTPDADGEAISVDGELTGTQALIASYRIPLTVTYNLQGGTWTDTNNIYWEKDGNYIEKVYKNNLAQKPKNPEKEGHIFDGWYTSEDYSKDSQYDFSAFVTNNITLYAKWTKTTDDNKKPSDTNTDVMDNARKTTSVSPKTGDITNMVLWVSLTVLSGLILAVIAGMKRKRKFES